jgi:hypothetical protein
VGGGANGVPLLDNLLDVGVDLVPAGGRKVQAANPCTKDTKGGASGEDVAAVETGCNVRVGGRLVFSWAYGQYISFIQVKLRAKGEGGGGHGGLDEV